jgi:Ca2+-binding EF-hand superfamily protein
VSVPFYCFTYSPNSIISNTSCYQHHTNSFEPLHHCTVTYSASLIRVINIKPHGVIRIDRQTRIQTASNKTKHAPIQAMSKPIMPSRPKKDKVEATNQDDVLDTAELNQILIKIRQHCFTHRGVDPGQLFDRWDRDKDGTLDYDEMRLLMYKVLSTSEQEFEQLFAFVDKDGDDVISREEFCEFVHTKPEKGAVLKEVDTAGSLHPDRQRDLYFKGLQKKQRVSVVGTRWNANDVLDEDELQLVHRKIRAASYTSKGIDIPALFAEWDIDNDGTLTRDEFFSAIRRLVPGITKPEFNQLCDLIDLEQTGGIDVVMVQNFVDKHNVTWQRKRVKRGEEDDVPCNDAVANAKWTGGLRPANNTIASTQLKQHGRKKITEAEMKRLRKKVCAESYTTGGMDLRRVYDRLVPADYIVDMKATIKFIRLSLPTLTCMDEINYVLSAWGKNRSNDDSLRFKDFQKWAKTKDRKKSVYRKTVFKDKNKKKHLGKDGIPESSRFTGHTMGKRYIQDDPMFNDLIPKDLFKDLNQSYHKKTKKDKLTKLAAEVGIDMDQLPDDATLSDVDSQEEYDGSNLVGNGDEDYQNSENSEEEFITTKERRTRDMLDLGTWSNSDGEAPEEEDEIAVVDKSGPQGEINTMLGARKYGGGRFRMPEMADISLDGQINFSMGGGTGTDDQQNDAVDYYWNKNIRDGKIREIQKQDEGEGDQDNVKDPIAENPANIFGLININVVSQPGQQHAGGNMNGNHNAAQQYGLFGKTARRLGTLEDLVDPGTWNFTPGQALGGPQDSENDVDDGPDDMYGGLPMSDPRGSNAMSIFDQQQQRFESNNLAPVHHHTMINRSPRLKPERQKSTLPADYKRLSQPKRVLTPTKPSSMSPNRSRPNNSGRSFRESSPRSRGSGPRIEYFAADSSGDEYSSVPPSPRSDRSSSSRRADPNAKRQRSKSTARWDPKTKKFVQKTE